MLLIKDEAALHVYLEKWVQKRLGKAVFRRHFLATVITVSGVPGKYIVTVQRLDESQPDPNTYLCSTPGYTPQTGDTVDVLWFDDTLGYVMWPLSGTGTAPVTPPGSVIAYAGTDSPIGWLFCNGSAVSRTTYAALFAVLASTYGAGDGSTTFNLPDMRGRAPIGAGTGSGLTARALAAQVGEEYHALSIAEMPSHLHTLGNWVAAFASGVVSGISGSGTANNTSATGSGTAHNTMQPSLTLNFIVKV